MQIVTLISDFGIKDHYASLLKGTILNLNSDIQFVDVTHLVDTYDIRQASYFLNAICKKFPKGTIHIVAVNNYYDPGYEIICFEYKGHYYIGPNNGVFSLAFDSIDEEHIYKIEYDETERDLFNLIAHGVSLISQQMSITEVGTPLNSFEKKIDIKPVQTQNEIRATIIHVDKYENVIINVHREFFEHIRNDRPFEIFFKYYNPITEISNTYSDVPIGEVLALFNSANYLEIALNMGKASSQLDLLKDETIQIRFL
ncbi:MAG: SAM-dependent chlorinase/fluorinase [Saprospiraceae bacterium]|nr:SAM-dependent chlorinase/fluorinase [Bacteroidia bacterium]MBT8228668.1 SAM-dependent chlorinase/fluorinase [Bacteroidia bacterium]NNF22202.1 SAM-dependent chlorinase/fluorinase [Saprospiraceae bacterium]